MDHTTDICSYIHMCGLDNEFSCVEAKDLRLMHFHKEEYLFKSGDAFTYLYLIISGKAKILPSSREGKLALIAHIESGDITGDLECVLGHPYLHNCVAIRETLVIAVPYEVVQEKLMNHNPFLRLLCRNVAEKLEIASKHQYRHALYSAKHIVSKALLQQAAQRKSDSFAFSCKDTAQNVRISERHLRRILSDFEDQSLIQKKGRHITLLDTEALKNMETEI